MLRIAHQEQRWKLEVMEEGLALIQAGNRVTWARVRVMGGVEKALILGLCCLHSL